MKTKYFSLMAVGLLAVSSASAALTGNITIQGAVANAVVINVTATAGYNALDLSATAADLQVASVNEKSNVATGYKVTLASANAGLLKNGTIDSLTYTAKYNGTSVTLSTTAQTVTNTTSGTGLVNVTKPVVISYTGQAPDTMMAGTYSDTLTFTIAAN